MKRPRCKRCNEPAPLKEYFHKHCSYCEERLLKAREVADVYHSQGPQAAFDQLMDISRASILHTKKYWRDMAGLDLQGMVPSLIAAGRQEDAKAMVVNELRGAWDYFKHDFLAYDMAKCPSKTIDNLLTWYPPDSRTSACWQDHVSGYTFGRLLGPAVYLEISQGNLLNRDTIVQWCYNKAIELGYRQEAQDVVRSAKQLWSRGVAPYIIYVAKQYAKMPNGHELLEGLINAAGQLEDGRKLGDQHKNRCWASFFIGKNQLDDVSKFLKCGTLGFHTSMINAQAAYLAWQNQNLTNALWIAMGYGWPRGPSAGPLLKFAPYLVAEEHETVNLFWAFLELVREFPTVVLNEWWELNKPQKF